MKISFQSEDQALALALQASLADSAFTPAAQNTSQRNTSATQQENADEALARALATSEKDERERQRRLNSQVKALLFVY